MSEKKPCEWIIKDIDGLFCGMQQEYYEEVDCNQCYYKQLQAIKQENEELKAENQIHRSSIYKRAEREQALGTKEGKL